MGDKVVLASSNCQKQKTAMSGFVAVYPVLGLVLLMQRTFIPTNGSWTRDGHMDSSFSGARQNAGRLSLVNFEPWIGEQVFCTAALFWPPSQHSHDKG